ncbi:MAG: sortase [Candidatus Levybacteria bacterium]|nr:sortase [Candidatus Levybacteria bacterium]
MTKSQIIRYFMLRSIGNFLLLFSIFGVIATFGPSLWYEAQYRLAQARGIRFTIAEEKDNKVKTGFGQILEQQRIAQNGGFRTILTGPKEQILAPIDTQFSILIPKVGANQKVFANVDSTNEKEFLPILYQGVAHAKGTVFPGMRGNIYLFAHSSDNFWDVGRYNAIFYLIKDLSVNDDIVLFFENRRHNYKVSETKVLDASEVSYLVNSQEGKEETLILQTCWPPGTTWKRLVVLAKPK